MILRFEDYELDDELLELRRRGSLVDVQPKPLALLLLLAKRAPEEVPRELATETLWSGVQVTGDSLAQAVVKLRRALADPVRGRELVVTKRGHGIRLEAEVQRLQQPSVWTTMEALVAELRQRRDEARGGTGHIAVLRGPDGTGRVVTARSLVLESRIAKERAVRIDLARRICEPPGPWEAVLLALRDPDPHQVAAGSVLPAPRILEAVRVLKESAEDGFLLLTIEALEHANRGAVCFFEVLANELDSLPLFVVACCRDQGVPALNDLEHAMLRSPRGSLLNTSIWESDEAAHLIRHQLPFAVGDRVVERVCELSGLVPGRMLRWCEHLAELGSTTDARPDEEAMLRVLESPPQSILGGAEEVLHSLSPKARSLAAVAARGGRTELDFHRLEIESGLAPADIVSAVDELYRHGVIRDSGTSPGAWRFAEIGFRLAAIGQEEAIPNASSHQEREAREIDDLVDLLADVV
ncbi:MAG: hypothetical protein GY937_27050 [bacterium]|nr:hypothetical protein [bacterium]